MSNKILVTGSSGLVGSRFVELFPEPNLFLTPSEQEFNLLNLESLNLYLTSHPVGAIVNFAAFTDVNAAEIQRGDKSALCWQLNVQGVKNILSSIDSAKTLFIQISTDMVFSGSSQDPGPYAENHLPEQDPNRVTWYGYTKYQGELAAGPKSAIVRLTNPVRANFQNKLDFFRKPLALFDQSALYPVFTDTQISISFIDEIVTALEVIIKKHHLGVYHISSSDVCTPFTAISDLLIATRGARGVVKPNSVLSLSNPVRYPQFGGLLCVQTEKILGLKFSSVQTIINQLVSQGLTV